MIDVSGQIPQKHSAKANASRHMQASHHSALVCQIRKKVEKAQSICSAPFFCLLSALPVFRFGDLIPASRKKNLRKELKRAYPACMSGKI